MFCKEIAEMRPYFVSMKWKGIFPICNMFEVGKILQSVIVRDILIAYR